MVESVIDNNEEGNEMAIPEDVETKNPNVKETTIRPTYKKDNKPTQPQKMAVKDKDVDEGTLEEFISDYLESVKKNTPTALKESLFIAIRMVRFLIKTNNMNLYRLAFEKLFRSESKYIIAPEIVFQYLTENKDSDKIKVETFYSTMVALDRYLTKPKKMGFPFDLNQVTISFGDDGLANFVKNYLR